MILLPTPHVLESSEANVPWPERIALRTPATIGEELGDFLPLWCERARSASGNEWETEAPPAPDEKAFACVLAHEATLGPEAYILDLGATGIHLRASGPAGWRHGLHTLLQIVEQAPERCAELHIEDAPARSVRGYMLDLSRDKVPTTETLRQLVVDLAALKFNQLQLYTEHTFAFPGHESVWGLASPLTRDEIRDLDAWCQLHGIELVPCINTLGHWERWLRHPEYFRYAECPYGWRRPDGYGMPWGSTLEPSPASRELLGELMAAYLPLFSSDRVNIGGDEPWELGMGKSRERCEQLGRHHIYLEHLRDVIALARAHKREVLFWSDVLLESPELWTPSEPETVALVWGYETGHPYPEQTEALRKQNQPAWLCPGTSTWNSLGGRLDNALANIAETGRHAEEHGIEGLVLTDWGDHGHHQPAVLSLPAMHAFAQVAWNPSVPAPELEATLGQFAFDHTSLTWGRVLRGLGSLEQCFQDRTPNRLRLVEALTAPEGNLPELRRKLPPAELENARSRLRSLAVELANLSPETPDDELRAREIALVLDLQRHACDRLLGGEPSMLRREMTRLIGEFEALWISRNRVGGLHESSGRLRRALRSYPTEPGRRPTWPLPPDEG